MIKVQPSKNIKDGIAKLIAASIEDYNKFSKNMVHSFIVKKAFKHFKEGDVLKAASWAAPALNQPRGNVLDGNYHMQWTGPLYLT